MLNQRVLVSWLPIAIAITITLGATYAAVQQNYRQSANDPQIQLAEDGIEYLKQGVTPTQLSNRFNRVDIKKSLNTFAMFFDENGKLQETSGYVGSSIPSLPAGVLESSRSRDINKVTWEIPTGERFAAVVKYWSAEKSSNASSTPSGFLLVARSLREIENRAFNMELIIAISWIIAMVLSLIAVWFKVQYEIKFLRRVE